MWAMRLRLLWLTVRNARGAEAVEVDYEVLEAVIAVDSAMDAGKPQIHPEAAIIMIMIGVVTLMQQAALDK